MSISIIIEPASSRYVYELRELLENKWGKFPSFIEEKDGVCPPPIIAIKNDILLGGLVFSLYPDPKSGKMSIWINGVIVKPEYRRNKVATKLILKAMETNALLFVNTEFENLYKNIGWIITGESDSGKVLQYTNYESENIKEHIV